MSANAKMTACAFVARAQALVAELIRLSERVPKPLMDATQGKYAKVLFDYAYFDSPLVHDDSIEQSSTAIDLDDELKANYGPVCWRYFCWASDCMVTACSGWQ